MFEVHKQKNSMESSSTDMIKTSYDSQEEDGKKKADELLHRPSSRMNDDEVDSVGHHSS